MEQPTSLELALHGFGALAVLAVLMILTVTVVNRINSNRETKKVDAGALAAPYQDLSIFTPGNRSDELIMVHRDEPNKNLGTVTATSSGFLARYGTETPETYPTTEEAAHALAARHVELAPTREAETRAAEDNARALQQFGKSPRR